MDDGMTTSTPSETEERPPLDDPDLYTNREVSWLDFNERVLELAEDASIPLLERVKFTAIFSSNLDEFFMIRVAGLQDQIEAGIEARGPDGLDASGTASRVRERSGELCERQAALWSDELAPALAEEGIRVAHCDDVPDELRAELDERYRRQIYPVLTPLAVGPGRPFPYISNLSLSLAVLLRDPDVGTTTFARVKAPAEILGRFVALGDRERPVLVPLEEVIRQNIGDLFPGMEVVDHAAFRVTRDADFEVSDEADDLLEAVEVELRRRRMGEVVRVELESGSHQELREQLVQALGVEESEVFELDGLLDLANLMEVYSTHGHPDLRDEPYRSVIPAPFVADPGERADMFAEIRKHDVLVHHPYESFSRSVERFVEQAVADPDVLAIKQTVYRTSDESTLVPLLIEATERGKQAVCLVELKARFDEQANIGWARRLEEAGVHVTYGVPGLKTHAKAILVIRREGDGVRHYVHVGTGNYNPKTARLYTDLGLFTTDEGIGSDVGDMFNQLTGYGRPEPSRKVLLAPNALRDGIIERIDRVIARHEAGEDARITMKINALVDRRCITALYRASQAGVPVELNVRGICCLRPGVPGVSENIHVTSVVGRFLEHTRAYIFAAGDDVDVLIGSADLMPRNLDQRVELVTPVLDPRLQREIVDLVDLNLSDDANAWDLGPEGTWTRRTPGDPPTSSQATLMARYHTRVTDSSGG
jgi:polyphosphate kinase